MPLYAGSFYPAEKEPLDRAIRKMLEENPVEATLKKFKISSSKIRALIVPHAGYVYSGPVAAAAYNALSRTSPKRIVLLGPSHQDYIDGAYSFAGEWITPLGAISARSHALLPRLRAIDDDQEHSLEVQVPFIQVALEQAKGFEFAPVIYGEIDAEDLFESIGGLVSKQSIFIASSDLSHYLPYAEAKTVDTETIRAILSLDYDEFMRIGDACGKTGIAALMLIAEKNRWKPFLLDYRNSGDTAGSADKNRVVGYASIVFVEQ